MRLSAAVLSLAGFVLQACGPGRTATWDEPQAAPASVVSEQASGPQAQALREQAEAAWANRDTRQEAERAITLWEELLQLEANNGDLLAMLARAHYFYADGALRLAGEDDAMLAAFEKGIQYGERALIAFSPAFGEAMRSGAKIEESIAKLPPHAQSGLYWYATNLGKFAAAKGFTTMLFYKDRILAVMQRVLEIDETFFYGAPHRYFGVFYAKAPAFAGGDLEKSKQHFERALELAPAYLGTRVLYAEFYATKTDDKELFTKLLGEVTAANATSLADIVPEQRLEQQKADFLLAKIDELF